MQIERFYTRQLASGGREGTALAPKTVRNTHVVLRQSLADAERLGLVPRNAAAAARPPTPIKRLHESSAWSDRRADFEQLHAAAEAATALLEHTRRGTRSRPVGVRARVVGRGRRAGITMRRRRRSDGISPDFTQA